ncbi:MAG: universal stress protein [Gemmatimonadetes bacterium]|nr:universal stress protein [Gemmatimonadota bacterium]
MTTSGPAFARVLVATDFALDGDRAVRRAAFLPLADKALIVVTHVLPGDLAPAVATVVAGAATTRLDGAAAKLRRMLEDLGRQDVSVRTRLARGRAATEIARAAQANGAQLVAVGRGDHPLIGRLGSTAQRVAQQSRVPVLLVRRPSTEPYRRIVVGMDTSADALVAAQLAARLASASRCQLVAVHAFDDPRGDLTPSLSSRVARAQWKKFTPTLATIAKDIRRALKAAAPDRTWAVSLRPGDPRQQLLAAAERRRADLIVVGTRSARGLSRIVLGSVTEAVLRNASCDVLVSPRRRWVI